MTTLGPYELNNIYCGECSELMAELPDNCIDLTVTSPPYDKLRKYKGFVFPFEQIALQLYRVTKKGGVVVWVVGDATINGSETGSSFSQALYFMEIGFRLHDTMIYAKKTYIPLTHNRYEQQFEYMFVFSKGKPRVFNPIKIPCMHPGNLHTMERATCAASQENSAIRTGEQRKPHEETRTRTKSTKTKPNIWFYDAGSNTDAFMMQHPASFPEQLANDHIISWSNPGDIVFDPMVGSGTTCKMAKILGRQYLGFDISPEYVELSKRRSAATNPPLFVLD